MRYKLHRIAPNSEGWRRPSTGRLGQAGVGKYVGEHGFGHEDWNFNFSLADGGNMLGYTVAYPSRKFVDESFGLILATYDVQGWRAVGYYNGAVFLDQPPTVPPTFVEQMTVDIFELAQGGQLGGRYLNMTATQIERHVRKDFRYFCWSIPVERVHIFRQPLPIPTDLFSPGKQRMKTSFDLTQDEYRAIAKLGPDVVVEEPRSRETEEGRPLLRIHKGRERSAALVAEFKAELASFACSVCSFDFGVKYGTLGARFIECHHIKPIADMKPGDRTKISDLRAVCSNCHRMLHHSNPMLTPDGLRDLIQS